VVKAWRDPKANVSVHMSPFGWMVEVWQQNKLLYSEIWDKKPTHQEKKWLIEKYEKPIKEEG
jgi:hypothetical protein